MDDADQLHATLALVARGVQRMADSFGALEQRLERLEAAVAPDPQVHRLADAVRGLRDDLAIATTQIEARIAERPEPPAPAPAPVVAPPATADVDRLVDAVRALRDDLAAATTRLQSETTATVERTANEHGTRLAQLREAIIEMRDAIPVELVTPAATGPAPQELISRLDALDAAVDGLRQDLRTIEPVDVLARFDAIDAALRAAREAPEVVARLEGIEATIAGLRQTAVAQRGAVAPAPEPAALVARFDAIDHALTAVRADIAAATAPIDADDPLEPRLQAIEVAVTHLRDDLAIDRLELSLRQMGGELERVSNDTSGLRSDVRAVLHEVKAIDDRLGAMGDDLRLVRGLRDGLEALASGVDAVRILASKGATSQQMGELGRDLTALLAEIESARSQVLAVDQHVSQPGAIDVAPAIQRLEQAVGDDVDELGRRIEQLAAAVEAQQAQAQHEHDDPPDVTEAIASRLRGLATGARQLGLGISEDLRSRNRKKKSRR